MMMAAEYRKTIQQVIALAACAVQGIIPDEELVSAVNPDHLYEAAQFHRLAAVVGMALESADCRIFAFQKAIAESQRRTLLFDRDRAAVLAALEREGIWYMPMKGILLKDMYPRFGMREMADNDILFDADRAQDLRRIMQKLGFTADSLEEGAHDTFHKPPVSNFEMHRMLFAKVNGINLYEYYRDVKTRLIKDDNNAFGYHLSPEDFYLYITAHEYKHYTGEGTGLRSLLDIYVCLRKMQQDATPDLAYIAGEADRMGIAAFEQNNRALAMDLFEGHALSKAQQEMLEAFVSDGVYGSMEAGVRKQVTAMGRFRYFLSRLIPPYDNMREYFPILRKAPYLYPLIWVWRLIRGILFRREKVRVQLKGALGKIQGTGIAAAAGKDTGE